MTELAPATCTSDARVPDEQLQLDDIPAGPQEAAGRVRRKSCAARGGRLSHDAPGFLSSCLKEEAKG
jgi:hypothetical protein